MNFVLNKCYYIDIVILYCNQGEREPYDNNNIIISEVAASNMTSLPQEFDASGFPSLRPYLNYLLENGVAEHVKVKWGRSERYVINIDGKKFKYKGGHDINKNLGKNIIALYISMSNKSSNTNKNITDLIANLKKVNEGQLKTLDKYLSQINLKKLTELLINYVPERRF